MSNRLDLPRSSPAVAFAAALTALLTLAWLIYYPGLDGSFLFDDFPNLKALGIMGPIHDWPSFARYVVSGGTTEPLGRPLSMLSFLIDAQNWPAVWERVRQQLGPVQRSALELVGVPATPGPNSLAIHFPADYGSAYDAVASEAGLDAAGG